MQKNRKSHCVCSVIWHFDYLFLKEACLYCKRNSHGSSKYQLPQSATDLSHYISHHAKCTSKLLKLFYNSIVDTDFYYPRPVLGFVYCRCLRVCVYVCVCVCVSVNHKLVRAIIHQPFKLGSLNLDQRCKRSWLRALLFSGAIDLDLQGQIKL